MGISDHVPPKEGSRTVALVIFSVMRYCFTSFPTLDWHGFSQFPTLCPLFVLALVPYSYNISNQNIILYYPRL